MNGMNKIERMIEELCPEGVEYKKLGEVCEIMNGKDYKHLSDGDIPVYGSGGIMTYVDTFAYDKPSILLPRKGSIGNIFYVDKPFWTVDTIYWTIIDKNYTLPKFLYYYLSTVNFKSMNKAVGAVPSMTQKIYNSIVVPLPPLPIQEEIVRILDKFSQLEAELEAELDCRKRQYEYYRDKLLGFEGREDVEWKKLGDVCQVLRGKRLTKKELSENGTFPVFHGGLSPIGYYTSPNRAANSAMIIDVGASAGTVGYSDKAFWSSDGCFCFSHEDNTIYQKYLYYYLQSIEISIKGKVRTAGIPTLDNKDVERLSIPIPSLSEQQHIADILDRFEALTSDISQGLPAEIKARHQQYEYYRDKLLTFKPKTA